VNTETETETREAQLLMVGPQALNGFMRRLFDIGRVTGTHGGYKEALQLLGVKIKKLEEELASKPHDGYVLGEVSALVQFADTLRTGVADSREAMDGYLGALVEYAKENDLMPLLVVVLAAIMKRAEA
jgi:hypothetical protein